MPHTKKVLVLDDDAYILDAVQIMLQMNGYTVSTLQKGESLSQLQDNLPDVIIMDVLLSGEDGRTIAGKLKEDPVTKDIPIIMVSAHPNVEISAKECGAEDFLAKPFESSELLSLIEKYTT